MKKPIKGYKAFNGDGSKQAASGYWSKQELSGIDYVAVSAGSALAVVDGLPPFLSAANLIQFISDELRQSTTPIPFRTPDGNRAYGYKAELLPMVCEVIFP